MTRKSKLKPVNSRRDIPTHFDSEDEEREWWAEHELTEKFFAESEGDIWTQVANLELQIMRLTGRLDCLTEENQALKDRVKHLESRSG
jgi:hypothetical protein